MTTKQILDTYEVYSFDFELTGVDFKTTVNKHAIDIVPTCNHKFKIYEYLDMTDWLI